MKILMVIPKNELTDKSNFSYTFPLGLGYISSTLKRAKHNVDCLNLKHYGGTIKDLMTKTLDKKDYDFVCTGAIAMQFRVVEQIVETTRNHRSKPRTILGGMMVITEPELMFNLLNPDFAIIGEGEKVIIKLLECIEKNKDFSKIKGLMYKDSNNEIRFLGKSDDIQDLDSLPYPDFEGFEFEKKLDNTTLDGDRFSLYDYPRVYPILGSRGCPFHCTFCYHYSKYRKRSLDKIIEELRFAIKKYQINTIMFYDECISIHRERLLELCKRIKDLRDEIGEKLTWVPQLTVHSIDEELLKAMWDSGTRSISYGFESFSPVVLKSMKKPITPEMIANAFHKTIQAGMFVQANFIFGDVAETWKTAQETLKWWKENSNGQIALGFIQPYPGSEIYHRSIEKGVIKNKIDFIKDMKHNTWFNMTDGMTDKEIKNLKRELLDAERKHCKFTHVSSIKETKDGAYEFDVKCPHCSKTIHYKNFKFANRKASRYNYHFRIVCRNCHLGFIAISPVRRLIYKYFPLIPLLIAKDLVRDTSIKMKRVKLTLKDKTT